MSTFKLPPLDKVVAVLQEVQKTIQDDWIAHDGSDPDDPIPGVRVTIGASLDGTWDYQTGDAASSGCAYHHKYWASGWLYQGNGTGLEIKARYLIGQIEEAMTLNSQFDE